MSAAPPKTEAVPPEIGALELEMEACLDGADVVEQEGFVQDRAVGFTETDTRAHVMARDGGRKTVSFAAGQMLEERSGPPAHMEGLPAGEKRHC